ncbi:DUF535 family protein [Methylomicrobium sp. Wu6]|uniref:DUF535 family protein n=1 Tax=Methylomicrobium sp. Wu6 TaxID=3107928 RepID=UPI002DD672B7|nr:DUF535 family protein [Methylomicrobium sp. Wu6]MEC4747023.1 DUF535 family protein [Methylomicrobium sp. Wu6]
MSLESPFIPNRFTRLQFSAFNPSYIQLINHISRYCHPDHTYKRLKMFCRSLLWSKLSGRWFQQVACSPVLSELVRQEKSLPDKLYRHLLRLDHSIDQRAKILGDHYTVIENILESRLMQQILVNGGLTITRLDITAEHSFELVLRYGGYPGKEGELAFFWQQTGDFPFLARVSFTLIPQDGHLSIYIGGIQGPAVENARKMVAEASKLCSGLSPKRIALEGVFAFAKHIGADTILGVSDAHHISRKKNSKYFSYDAYWLELGGQRNKQDDYELPPQPLHKPFHETPTKRRAKYRRQHSYLEFIHNDALKALNSATDRIEIPQNCGAAS